MAKENAQTRWRARNPEKSKEIYRRVQLRYIEGERGRATIKKNRYKLRDKRRQFILDFFGGQCVRCGFTDGRALQMDHINGKEPGFKVMNIDSRYSYLINNPEKAREVYQMLCANC